MLQLLAFLYFVSGTNSASVPFVEPCKLRDNVCLKKSAIKALPSFVRGVPELGMESLDPLKLPLITSDNLGLQLTFTNSTLTGLEGCSLEDIKYESDTKISLAVKCNVVLSGDYVVDGTVIILPVKGNGKYKIDIHGILIKGTVYVETVNGKDGQTYWHIKKLTHSYDVLTGAKFDFDNLFNGNRELGDPVLQLINKQWKLVMEEIAVNFVKAIIDKIHANFDALLLAVPISEILIN